MKQHYFQSNPMSKLLATLLFALLLTSLPSFAQSPIANSRATPHTAQLDALTQATLQSILTADWASAAISAQQLNETFPDYALGQMLLAETHSVLGMSDPLVQRLPNYSSSLVQLLLEARARAQHVPVKLDASMTHTPAVPDDIIQVGSHIDNLILVDLNDSTLYLFDTTTDKPTLVKEHYISSGEAGFGKEIEGDLKTPLGVYQIYGFRGDRSLPALYGSGALMLNYPNALDRSLGRSGSGIWLHGNPPQNRSRSPRSSEGCVTMANDHLLDLYEQIDIGRTHVVLSSDIQWSDWDQSALRRERFQELFEQFRSAWLNSNVKDLMALYSPSALPAQVRYAGNAMAKKVSVDSNLATTLSPMGIDLNALAQMQASDVSILLNPSINESHQGKHLIMAFELPDRHAARMTIYWELDSDGYWQIKREEIDSNGA